MQRYLKIAVLAALAVMAQPAFATADRDSAEVRIAYGSQPDRMVTSAVSPSAVTNWSMSTVRAWEMRSPENWQD